MDMNKNTSQSNDVAVAEATNTTYEMGGISQETTELDRNTTIEYVDRPPVTNNTLDDWIKRQVLISTYEVTETSHNGLLLTNFFTGGTNSYFDVFQRWSQNPYITQKLAGFKFFKGDLDITVTFNAPPTAFGGGVISYFYEGNNIGLTGMTQICPVSNASVEQAYQTDNAVPLDLATSPTITTTLAFSYYKPMVEIAHLLNNTARMGNFCYFPVTTLQSTSTTAANYTIKVYAKCSNPTLSFPITQMQKSGPPKKASELLGGLAHTDLSAVPIVGQFGGLINQGAKAASAAASALGYTRENDKTTNMPMVIRNIQNPMPMDSKDASDIVAFTTDNSISIDPRLGGGTLEDQASFASLSKRWTMIGRFNITTNDLSGADIMQIPVSPFFTFSNPNLPTTLVYGPMAYMALPFSQWRGGMEYKIMIYCSNFHRGQLIIFHNDKRIANNITNITNQVNHHIMDLTVQKDYCFRVDYISNEPSLTIAASNVFADGVGMNGFLNIRVQSTLTAPITPSTIQMVILSRPCADMVFGIPRATVRDTTGNLIPISSAVNVQGFGVGQLSTTEECIDLVKATSSGPNVVDWGFGENIKSARAIAQKMTIVGNIKTVGNVDNYQIAVFSQYMGPRYNYTDILAAPNLRQFFAGEQITGTSYSSRFNWYGHVAIMFNGVRSSARVKLLGNTNGMIQLFQASDTDRNWCIQDIGTIRRAKPLNIFDGETDPMSLRSVCTNFPNGGYEAIFPYYTKDIFRPTNILPYYPVTYGSAGYPTGVIGTVTYPYNTIIINQASLTPEDQPSVGGFALTQAQVWYGAGPDVTFIRFCRVPRVAIVDTSVIPPLAVAEVQMKHKEPWKESNNNDIELEEEDIVKLDHFKSKVRKYFEDKNNTSETKEALDVIEVKQNLSKLKLHRQTQSDFTYNVTSGEWEHE